MPVTLMPLHLLEALSLDADLATVLPAQPGAVFARGRYLVLLREHVLGRLSELVSEDDGVVGVTDDAGLFESVARVVQDIGACGCVGREPLGGLALESQLLAALMAVVAADVGVRNPAIGEVEIVEAVQVVQILLVVLCVVRFCVFEGCR